jgi:hypothetical protein
MLDGNKILVMQRTVEKEKNKHGRGGMAPYFLVFAKFATLLPGGSHLSRETSWSMVEFSILGETTSLIFESTRTLGFHNKHDKCSPTLYRLLPVQFF